MTLFSGSNRHPETRPETEASRILERFWNRRCIPVDPFTIARRMGLEVKRGPLPQDVSGVLRKIPGDVAVIVLEATDSFNRKRFTCAHELGHYILRAGDADYINVEGYVELRGTASTPGEISDKVFANQFAAFLLMPREEVVRRFRSDRQVYMLAPHFGVSDEAMRYHLENLRMKSDKVRRGQ